MTGQRVGALVVAIALVVGAFVVRRNVIEDDDDTAADDTAVDEPERDDATVLYCITELADVCEALGEARDELDIVVEDAGATLDRLAALERGEQASLWLTVDPYPAMADLSRPTDPLGFESRAVGASQLAVAFRSGDKAATIAAFCAADATALWRCLGEHAGANWSTLGAASIAGTLRPSFGDVAGSAIGLTSFASAIAGYFGAADVDRTQFDDTAFLTWLRRVSGVSLDGTQRGRTPLETLAVRESALDAAATATFEINDLDATGERFDVNYAEPEMWIQAVIATPAGVAAPDGLATEVAAALAAAGWDSATAAGSPVSSASTLLALRQLWNDAT